MLICSIRHDGVSALVLPRPSGSVPPLSADPRHSGHFEILRLLGQDDIQVARPTAPRRARRTPGSVSGELTTFAKNPFLFFKNRAILAETRSFFIKKNALRKIFSF